MTDNTLLNPGSPGGDTVRTLDRTGTGTPKTEVVQLDAGGPDPNSESLVNANNPLTIQSQYLILQAQLLLQSLLLQQAAQIGGYYPINPDIAAMLGIQQP